MPAGEIREALVREGYSKEDIDKVFTPKAYNMKSWYLTFAILLCLAGIYQVIVHNGFLLLALSAGLFGQYFREDARLKNTMSKERADRH